MTRFANRPEITFEIATRIVASLNSASWGHDIFASRNGSAVSASEYVEVAFENEDGDMTETFCIRISDHEARSYNRTGDFNITLGGVDGDTHETLNIEELTDEDGEFEGYEADEVAIAAIIARSVEAVRAFHATAEF